MEHDGTLHLACHPHHHQPFPRGKSSCIHFIGTRGGNPAVHTCRDVSECDQGCDRVSRHDMRTVRPGNALFGAREGSTKRAALVRDCAVAVSILCSLRACLQWACCCRRRRSDLAFQQSDNGAVLKQHASSLATAIEFTRGTARPCMLAHAIHPLTCAVTDDVSERSSTPNAGAVVGSTF